MYTRLMVIGALGLFLNSFGVTHQVLTNKTDRPMEVIVDKQPGIKEDGSLSYKIVGSGFTLKPGESHNLDPKTRYVLARPVGDLAYQFYPVGLGKQAGIIQGLKNRFWALMG